MSPPPGSRRERLAAFLERIDCPGAPVERLVQDAGDRVYYRVRLATGASPPVVGTAGTFVACVMSRPYARGSLPFAESAALYRRLGVPAPAIGVEAPDLGVLALEDLGDLLLQTAVQGGDPRTRALYREAVAIVGVIQREGARLAASGEASRYRAFAMRLDEPLFLRELRYFREHFVEPRRRDRTSAADDSALDRQLGELAAEAAALPPALCHRDYHSRNLIAKPLTDVEASRAGPRRELRVIDHQDTRIGPRLYDLVSLVRDPYVAGGAPPGSAPFEEDALVAQFLDETGRRDSLDALRRELDTVALQRELKALGTYGFQVYRRSNPVYRAFIAPTLAMVRENLDRWPERRQLRALLADLLDPSA